MYNPKGATLSTHSHHTRYPVTRGVCVRVQARRRNRVLMVVWSAVGLQARTFAPAGWLPAPGHLRGKIMRMHNRLQGLALAAMAVAVTLCSGSVARADGFGPSGPPPYGPPPMSYERPYGYGCCTWAGFYGGVNFGYGWSANSDQLALDGDNPTGLSPVGGFGGGLPGQPLCRAREDPPRWAR